MREPVVEGRPEAVAETVEKPQIAEEVAQPVAEAPLVAEEG